MSSDNRKEYGRKPYISKSYHELLTRAPNSAMWDQELSKHSEFEKPYKGDGYKSMQHYWPNFPGISIPNMDFPWNTGDPVPDTTINPNSGNVQSTCCLLDDNAGAMSVAQGDTYKIFVHKWCWIYDIRGVKMLNDPVVSWVITSENAQILSQSNAECIIKVDDDAKPGSLVMVDATVRSGIKCSKNKWVEAGGCGGASISYTTNQMSINDSQTLTVDSPKAGSTYDWAIIGGGGSLGTSSGLSTIYTAPSANVNCDQNPTITLSSGGTVCDILKIAVNAANYNVAYEVHKGYRFRGHNCPSGSQNPTGLRFDIWVHSCDGTRWDYATGTCCPDGVPDNQLCSGYYSGNIDCGLGSQHSYYFCVNYENSPEDVRTAQMKAEGCCPAGLL